MVSSSTTTVTDSSYDTISLAQVKSHLRLSHNDLDTELTRLIKTCTVWCERASDRVLRGLVTKETAYPSWSVVKSVLPWQPVAGITSIKYQDSSDAEQTLSSSEYRLIVGEEGPSRIEFDSSFTWPATKVRSDAIKIRYTAGYATVDDVPELARDAILSRITVQFGDLSPLEMDRWSQIASDLTSSMRWGSYP